MRIHDAIRDFNRMTTREKVQNLSNRVIALSLRIERIQGEGLTRD